MKKRYTIRNVNSSACYSTLNSYGSSYLNKRNIVSPYPVEIQPSVFLEIKPKNTYTCNCSSKICK